MNIREKLASVKASVSIVDVLKSHNVSVPQNTETQISCPFHGADSHPSARVYTRTNTIFCWTCHRLWDVIAAEMQFNNCDIAEALDSLIAKFNVKVEEQPQELQRFYSAVNKYVRGDQKIAQETVEELADKFRRFYIDLPEWRQLLQFIYPLWYEYDKITSAGGDVLELVVPWYEKAYAIMAAQQQTRVENSEVVQTDLEDDEDEP